MEAVKPMLAETGNEPFDSPDHIFEWKWNGLRILTHKDGTSASLQGRSGADFTAQFPELADIAKHIKVEHAIIDGEVVCMGQNGLPEFNRIQYRIGKRDPLAIKGMMALYPAVYVVFDVLEVDDYDLRAGGKAQATLMQRKEILRKILDRDETIKLSPYTDTNGKQLHAEAVRLQQEGVMAKSKSGLYYPGGRKQDWLKLKIPKFATFVIGGYTKGTGWRAGGIGAVVLGKPNNGSLRWVGCAGSGFQQKELENLFYDLENIRTGDSPFEPGTKVPDLETWVRPELVVEVKYFDITKDGKLIWPIFQRMRPDLKLQDVRLGN